MRSPSPAGCGVVQACPSVAHPLLTSSSVPSELQSPSDEWDMLSIIHIKGERQPSEESKSAINLTDYCSFYMMDGCFSLSTRVLGVCWGQGRADGQVRRAEGPARAGHLCRAPPPQQGKSTHPVS